MENDKQTAERATLDLDHVRENYRRLVSPTFLPDFLRAAREISQNMASLVGDGHVPVPSQGSLPDLEYAALLASVASANVRVFVSRPHDVRDSELFQSIASAIRHFRVGFDSARV